MLDWNVRISRHSFTFVWWSALVCEYCHHFQKVMKSIWLLYELEKLFWQFGRAILAKLYAYGWELLHYCLVSWSAVNNENQLDAWFVFEHVSNVCLSFACLDSKNVSGHIVLYYYGCYDEVVFFTCAAEGRIVYFSKRSCFY